MTEGKCDLPGTDMHVGPFWIHAGPTDATTVKTCDLHKELYDASLSSFSNKKFEWERQRVGTRRICWTVYGGNTPTPSIFDNEKDAVKEAERLMKDSWVSRVSVIKSETVFEREK